jgi:hypothetical protein
MRTFLFIVALFIFAFWVLPMLMLRRVARWAALHEHIRPKRILLYGPDFCAALAVAGMNQIIRLNKLANRRVASPAAANVNDPRGYRS